MSRVCMIWSFARISCRLVSVGSVLGCLLFVFSVVLSLVSPSFAFLCLFAMTVFILGVPVYPSPPSVPRKSPSVEHVLVGYFLSYFDSLSSPVIIISCSPVSSPLVSWCVFIVCLPLSSRSLFCGFPWSPFVLFLPRSACLCAPAGF